MTGAAACLAGFEGITVVIHGSSGCYYYPATLLHAPLAGTFLIEREVIFGSEDRLREVLDELARDARRIAVVTTCVPAAIGEDIRAMLSNRDVILVESPGFAGQFEAGVRKAVLAVCPEIDDKSEGVMIDGVSIFDPFCDGNVLELTRMLGRANVPVSTVLCRDHFEMLGHCAPHSITADSDLAAGIGTSLGGTLGFEALRETFGQIGNAFATADTGPLFAEIDRAEERTVAACDKYLRRFDPPTVAVFSGFSCAAFAAQNLVRYLDAEIACIGSRVMPDRSLAWPVTFENGMAGVEALIQKHQPDLILGSSFECSVRGEAAFVGLTPPLRGKVRLFSRPLAGTEGMLIFMENVLNACMDRKSEGK